MRNATLGLVVLVGLTFTVAATCLAERDLWAQRPAGFPTEQELATGKLLALSAPAGEKQQQVTVIDSQTRTMSVYHIDLSTGEIALKSVRNIRWDLQMEEFNGTTPAPREIRALLERR